MSNLLYTQKPSGKCPVQAEGTIDGLPFYFRSRGGHWSLSVASTPNGDVFANDAWVHRERYDGVNAHRDAEINDGRLYAAGWAEEDECIAFIEKAAALFASRPSHGGNKP